MKLIDENGRLFGKISIVDVLALLAAAAVVAAVYGKGHMPQTGSVTLNPIVYQLRLENQPQYLVDALRVGDQMFDRERSTGGSLGTITAIEVTDGSTQGTLLDGTYGAFPTEERYNVLLTIESEGMIAADGAVALNRIYDIGVNSSRYFNTKYANFIGTIAGIQILDADAAS